MDFSWSEEQLAYKKGVIDFALANLAGDVVVRDQESEFSRSWWGKCAEFGIQGLPIPEEYGGAEADILTCMLTMEGLGYACRDLGLIFGLNAQLWSVQMPLLSFGTEKQRKKYLPDLCNGNLIGAHGMSEPDSGSDAYSLRMRAQKTEGGYLLNGTKTFVTNAPVADLALVFATIDPSKGMWGVTAFVVDVGTPGFRIGRPIEKMGLRTAPMAELIFEDCFLPDSARLGPEARQLEQSIQYSREREQFNQPIGKFQSVANRIVDMKLRLETSQLLLYKVAWLKSMGKQAVMEAALAKLYLSECFVASSLDAIRIHGGYGYSTEFEIERDLRDAVGGTLYSGTSDIQRNIIARLLGL